MITKQIHYCWFGRNPLPPLAKKCIASWKKYMPDYEIIEWNEDNFDVNSIPYTRDAYKEKKYAFVSDYARLWILYQYGGIYFDTDVEVIKSIDDIITSGAYMACETDGGQLSKINVNPGLGLAAPSGHIIYKELLDQYSNFSFYNEDNSLNLTTIVQYTTCVLFSHGLRNIKGIQYIDDICIYPTEYFCPKNCKKNTIIITDKTYTIHHFDASWLPKNHKIKAKISMMLGKKLTRFLVKVKRTIRFS